MELTLTRPGSADHAGDLYCDLRERGYHVTIRQAQILALLWAGHIVPYERLEAVLWGDDPDGGPEGPRRILAVYMCQLRRLGFQIVCHYRAGYQLVGKPGDFHA